MPIDHPSAQAVMLLVDSGYIYSKVCIWQVV